MTRAALAVLALAGACIEVPEDPGDNAATLRFTDRGVREYYPGVSTAQATWTTDGFHRELFVALSLVGGAELGTFAFDSQTVTWDTSDLAPGFYQVMATVMPRDGGGPLASVQSPAIEVVQGLRFLDDTLTLTTADVPRDLQLTIATASIIELEIAAEAGDARYPLGSLSVASDLAPISRFIAWTGAGIPAGEYRLFADVRTGYGNSPVQYRTAGPLVRWTP